MTIDHLCCNPPCVNTAHMEVVSNEENARRAMVGVEHTSDVAWVRSGTCRNGHDLQVVGVHRAGQRFHKDGTPYTTCNGCHREANNRYKTQRRIRSGR